MSSVLKAKLPRPTKFVEFECKDECERLVMEEMKVMIEYDNYKYPVSKTTV